MSETDDFAEELRGDEPMNRKGNDWVASIVGGVIVGLIVLISDRYLSKDDAQSRQLIEVVTNVGNLTKAVDKLTEQPYVRREEFNAGIKTLEGRIDGLDRRLDQREQRAGR